MLTAMPNKAIQPTLVPRELMAGVKFLRFIAYTSKTYEIYFLLRPNLKDEKDNMLVELAVTSQSDYLITSNVKDFENAELKFEQLQIITPSEFVKKWRDKYV